MIKDRLSRYLILDSIKKYTATTLTLNKRKKNGAVTPKLIKINWNTKAIKLFIYFSTPKKLKDC